MSLTGEIKVRVEEETKAALAALASEVEGGKVSDVVRAAIKEYLQRRRIGVSDRPPKKESVIKKAVRVVASGKKGHSRAGRSS